MGPKRAPSAPERPVHRAPRRRVFGCGDAAGREAAGDGAHADDALGVQRGQDRGEVGGAGSGPLCDGSPSHGTLFRSEERAPVAAELCATGLRSGRVGDVVGPGAARITCRRKLPEIETDSVRKVLRVGVHGRTHLVREWLWLDKTISPRWAYEVFSTLR